ncbi:GDSL esterase/lipase At4g10955-like [Diospyros lotus]|uniref:GDSL esterase/lipase At4g10955-like n=1 Tax=Diospyros lotus TaxID=55363 RepID=UPI00224DA0DB|nr:GDSL esterase/lipase At4g10955-like [Diospyros lotus]
MASEREIFGLSGPSHLTAVDWANLHHRRSIAASLVQGVYILERDRQQMRQGSQALAPPWWAFFHFHPIQVLADDADLSIFAAVYELRSPFSYPCNLPRYVLALRGTITKPGSRSQDLKLDFQFIKHKLQKTHRFELAMQAVGRLVSVAGPAGVWLAGHSLGAAMALLAGKNMAKQGFFLETYLFNPPFASAPIERIKNEKVRYGVRFASSVITAGIAAAVKKTQDNSFSILSGWIPYLFVNPSDPFCSEYIGYFEHRKKMVDAGAGAIASIATQNSIVSLLSGGLGKDSSEPPHLLPSAYLTVNLSPSNGFKRDHGIHQWWNPNIQCQFKLHQFK